MDGAAGQVLGPAVALGEGEGLPDQLEELLLGLAVVILDDRNLLLLAAGSAGKAVDGLAGHLVELGMEGLGGRLVQVVVMEEVVGGLPVAVGGNEPGAERAVAVILEDLLPFLDPLAVQHDRLVI